MEKSQFLDTEGNPWWLVETNVEFDLEDQRTRLSETLGWNDSLWFTDPYKLTELYDLIERADAQLLSDLDYVVDLAKQVEWMQRLVIAVGSSAPEPAAEEAENGRSKEPEVAAEAAPAAAAEAPVKKSIFAKKPKTEVTEAEVTEVEVTEEMLEEVAVGLSDLTEEAVESVAAQLKMSSEELAGLMEDDEFKSLVARVMAEGAGSL